MIIRKYKSSDLKEIANLFFDTVHSVNAKDYSPEQLNAWATGKVDFTEWDRTLSEHYSLVAVKDNIIAGFGDIDHTGYLDRLYVHRDYQHQNVATALCDELEQAFPVRYIITHASITAKPFFLQRDYQVITKQEVLRNGIALTNFIMRKSF